MHLSWQTLPSSTIIPLRSNDAKHRDRMNVLGHGSIGLVTRLALQETVRTVRTESIDSWDGKTEYKSRRESRGVRSMDIVGNHRGNSSLVPADEACVRDAATSDITGIRAIEGITDHVKREAAVNWYTRCTHGPRVKRVRILVSR